MSWKFDIDLPMPFEMRLNAHEYASRATMPVVRSSDEAWEAFARADEEFRAALKAAGDQVQTTLQSNCFGECVEGRAMAERVERVLRGPGGSITGRINNHSEFLAAHSDLCRSSARTIGQTDSSIG